MTGINIQSTANVRTDGIKAIVYGPAKIGKTRLCATAVNPFIVSTERGLLSLRKENIPYVEVSNIPELANVYNWLRSPLSAQFQTVCFDSISDLGEVVLGDEKKKSKDGRKAYGNTNETVMQIFRDFRDMPGRNVYFVAKEQQFSGANNLNCVRPTMPDAYLTQQLPYMFDVIAHMGQVRFQDGSTHVGLHTQSTEQVVAGDRSGTLAEWEPPNLAYIFDKIARG